MAKFRTVEVSNIKFESNNLRFITVKTSRLKGRGDIAVFVPPEIQKKPLPVVILLHGVYGSAWSWSHQGGVHIRAAQMIKDEDLPPMIIAMPSDGLWGDGSAYLPHNNMDFERWIALDVVDAIIENITDVSEESPFFIGGLSMGGFGALRIGAKYSSSFSGISGHSSITELQQMELFVEESLNEYEQKGSPDEDVFKTILLHKNDLPPIRFDCGDLDPLVKENRKLHQQLLESDIDHLYEEFSGGHEWAYWEKHIVDTLLFFANQVQKD